MVTLQAPTHKIAGFVTGTKLTDIPHSAVECAKLSILDTRACGFAALSQPVTQSIVEHVQSLGGGPVATVLGLGGYKTSPPLATLANRCLVNLLDYDGWFHAPTHTLPAALARGERERIAVHLKDGSTVEDPINTAFGRLDRDGMWDKYRDCTAQQLAPAAADRVREQVMSMERLASIAELAATLAVP